MFFDFWVASLFGDLYLSIIANLLLFVLIGIMGGLSWESMTAFMILYFIVFSAFGLSAPVWLVVMIVFVLIYWLNQIYKPFQ